MARVYGLTPNFAGDSVLSCQQFQENVNQIRNAVNHVRKTVNLFSKLPVNHIRKNTKNCQPKSGKDIVNCQLLIVNCQLLIETALSELLRRHAHIAMEISAEVGLVGKVEAVGNLLDAKGVVAQQEFGLLDDFIADDFACSLS